MISRLEYLATGDVLLSRQVVLLRAHLQLFFLRLFFMTDGAGRFRADAAVIRASLYAHELQQVSERDVSSRLQELHRAGLIKLYTEGDVGYGRVVDAYWQQSDRKRKVRHPAPALPGPAPGLFDESPPADPPAKPKAQVCVSPPIPSLHTHSFSMVSTPSPALALAHATGDQRLAEDCLADLAPAWPRHDLRACLRDARRYVRKQRGEDAEVTVRWFVEHWLPGAPEKKAAAKLAPAPAPIVDPTWAADQQARLDAIVQGPEPAPDTIEHAIWTEGRKQSA